jgi:hypothetical protein
MSNQQQTSTKLQIEITKTLKLPEIKKFPQEEQLAAAIESLVKTKPEVFNCTFPGDALMFKLSN